MHFLFIWLAFIVFSWVAPRAWRLFEFAFIAPFCGLMFGGAIWSFSAMFIPELVDLKIFTGFVIAATVAGIVLLARSK